MAIDLTDSLRPAGVRRALGKSSVLREKSMDIDAATDDASDSYDYYDAESERRSIRAAERAASSTDVRAVIREIEEETSKIRRLMTERYNIEFEANPRRTETR